MAANDRTTGFNVTAVVLLGAAGLILVWALALFLQGGFMAARARITPPMLMPPSMPPARFVSLMKSSS